MSSLAGVHTSSIVQQETKCNTTNLTGAGCRRLVLERLDGVKLSVSGVDEPEPGVVLQLSGQPATGNLGEDESLAALGQA